MIVITPEYAKPLPNAEIIKKDLKVMDTSACALCKQNKIPINVFDFKAQGSLVKIMNGENVGTVVSVN